MGAIGACGSSMRAATMSTSSEGTTARRTSRLRRPSRVRGHQCRTRSADSCRIAQSSPWAARRTLSAGREGVSGMARTTERVATASPRPATGADQRRRASTVAPAIAIVGVSTAGATVPCAVEVLAAQPRAHRGAGVVVGELDRVVADHLAGLDEPPDQVDVLTHPQVLGEPVPEPVDPADEAGAGQPGDVSAGLDRAAAVLAGSLSRMSSKVSAAVLVGVLGCVVIYIWHQSAQTGPRRSRKRGTWGDAARFRGSLKTSPGGSGRALVGRHGCGPYFETVRAIWRRRRYEEQFFRMPDASACQRRSGFARLPQNVCAPSREGNANVTARRERSVTI